MLCPCLARSSRAADFGALADAILSTGALKNAEVGVQIISLPEGKIVYAKNPDVPLKPASNAKLATTAAALQYLTPDFRFKTAFLIKREEDGKASVSSLVWRGSGDPSISGRGRSSPTEIFETWASTLTARGIRKIGRIILDQRYFEGPATLASWPAEELSYWYAAQTSAISFNDNCVGVSFLPGKGIGRRAKIILSPDFGYLKTSNRTRTAGPGSPFTLDYRRRPGTNKVSFFGDIALGDPGHSDFIAVHEPALYAAETLRAVWRNKGLAVRSRPVYWEKSKLGEDQLDQVLTWDSAPLSEIVKVINKNSQNLYAEQVLKVLGRQMRGHGSFSDGVAVVDSFLTEAGLAASDWHLADGSGLSDEDRITPRGLTQILRFMSASPLFIYYYESLAVPGVDRAARDRMKGDPLSAGMRVKPGTIAGARNLSGYLHSKTGKLYAFSVLINAAHLDRHAVDESIDELCLNAAKLLP